MLGETEQSVWPIFIFIKSSRWRLESIFYKVWIKLPKETQELLLNNYQGDVSYVPEKFKESLELMQTFREGKINISELNQLILDSLK